MTDQEFEYLAGKVLSEEASREEQAELKKWLECEPARKEEFADLELARDFLRQYGPLLPAMGNSPTPIPKHRLRQLQEAVRKARAGQEAEPFLALLRHWIGSYRRATATAIAVLSICIY